MHMYWSQTIHEAGSAPSQCYLLSLLETAHYSQCSGENMHLVQGVVMWPLVLLFCPKHMLHLTHTQRILGGFSMNYFLTQHMKALVMLWIYPATASHGPNY
jgi:hypothetical protein